MLFLWGSALVVGSAAQEALAGDLLVASTDPNDHSISCVKEYDEATGAYVKDFVAIGSGGLRNVQGLNFGPDGNLYVCSADTGEVLRYNGHTGAFVDRFIPAGTLSFPVEAVFGPNGDLFVSDYNLGGVLEFDASGNLKGDFVPRGSLQPWGLTFGPDHNLYVCNDANSTVVVYDGVSKALLKTFGGGWLLGPSGVAFDPSGGSVFVTSAFVIDQFDANGVHQNAFGNELKTPVGIDFKDGFIYVTSRSTPDAADTDKVDDYNFSNPQIIPSFVKGGAANGGLKRPTFLRFSTISKNSPPVANAGPSQTLGASPGPTGTATVLLNGTGSTDPDNDPLTYAWSWSGGTATGATPAITLGLGAWTITLTVDDGNNHQSTATVVINVVDVTPPTFSGVPAPITAEQKAPGQPTQVNVPSPTATDDINGPCLVTCDAPAAGFPLGTTKVTFTACDKSNNSATASTTVTVVGDTTPPVFTSIPSSITMEASGPSTPASVAMATATDDSGSCTVTSSPSPIPTAFPVGKTTITFTATDPSGNTATATTCVTMTDTTKPTITAPAAATAEATGTLTAVTLGAATASDAVGPVTITNNAPAGYPLGTTTVTFTAKDGAGNSASATTTVTVVDTTKPTLTAPAAATAEATGTLTAVTLGQATASDAVGPVTITNNAPAGYPLGTTTVTFTAKDGAGNTATASTTVTIVDTTAPALTVPAAATIEATAKLTPYTLPAATATDKVGPVTITNDAPATFPLGTTTVTFTAKHGAGNSTSKSTSVTVRDTTAPSFSNVPANVTIQATDSTGASYTVTNPTATDKVDGNVAVSNNAPAKFPVGTTTVTFTAKDGSGNTATASMTVTVTAPAQTKDTTPPVITCLRADPAIIRKHDEKMVAVKIIATATDNVDPSPVCKITSVTSNETANKKDKKEPDWTITGNLTLDLRAEMNQGDKDRIYTITVTCTDKSGNASSKTLTVVVTKKKKHGGDDYRDHKDCDRDDDWRDNDRDCDHGHDDHGDRH